MCWCVLPLSAMFFSKKKGWLVLTMYKSGWWVGGGRDSHTLTHARDWSGLVYKRTENAENQQTVWCDTVTQIKQHHNSLTYQVFFPFIWQWEKSLIAFKVENAIDSCTGWCLAEVKIYWRLNVHKSLDQVIVAKYEGENMALDKQIGQS